jgi:aminoglycoside 3'-phosphotransferase II
VVGEMTLKSNQDWRIALPPVIRTFVEGSECEPVDIGKSNASVSRFITPSRTLFLKTCPIDECGGLGAEVERLSWLKGRAPIPEVVAFARDERYEYLLVTSLPGQNGVEAGRTLPQVVVLGLARALKSLHTQPHGGCPFDQSIAAQVARARERVRAGVVDENDFDEERLGRTAEQLLVELEAWRPSDEAHALTHGDPCLPNVLFDRGTFVGFVDCGRAGMADPYQDLALAARSIASNLGLHRVPVFFEEYGLPMPDERKLAFYRLLDEFF